MARKNLLQSLIEDAAKPASDAPPAPPRPRKGAIGAVSQSIEALKARAVLELDPFEIDAGGLQDRLESDDAEDAALLASIRDYGQQVPVLVRPHPETDGRYQIVYGRRRVLALRDLGQPVKALLRDLDDTALVMAQGQENNARRGLSFIEKANFAAQMRDAGYDRKAMCDALAIDKTVVSRMLQIVDRLGPDLIQRIGAAPAAGRDRWAQLATWIDDEQADVKMLIDMIAVSGSADDSNHRFEIAYAAAQQDAAVTPPKPVPTKGKRAPSQRRTIKGRQTGIVIGTVQRKPDSLVLTLPRTGGGGFEEWLIDHLDEIHQTWSGDTADGSDE
ncbi:plasmid partitioning protein RepB [Tateyamaria sp. ANG-S1]|uniref:plasmid partitioning protein RepB n=1 Tax=Tateyamaria sp. ANG-S1 TaxID=1577905 RepID=UPI00057EE165|nr:plasmid partitioning protein RepB [Tateyamaria sp. ANG-S1]KIC47766.1 hypothetical protein RA29_19350 [Tateyamaria sp. ANG-S1]